MNENTQKQEIAFPISAIFCTLNALIEIIRIIYISSKYGVILNFLTVSSIISSVLLVIVLFMRKRGLFLWVPLGIDLALNLISAFSGFPSAVLLPIFRTVNGLLFLLFAVFQDRKEQSGAASSFRKIWFIPGIVSIIVYLFEGYQIYLGIINYNTTILNLVAAFSGPTVSIPMAFLLGWWLTHPYKKERPVYQMPAMQPYGQPGYQSVDAFDTAQKVFCSGCGQELSPDENFCSVCGKRRTTPAQGAQPVFQQQVNPQMGYVPDAPSGGMTALGFFIPIVGLILYLVWKDQTPLKAKSAGKGALIGVIVWTALSVILVILSYVIPLLVFYSYY